MRVLFLTGREATYARNEVLLRALRHYAEVDVVAPTIEPRSQWLSSLRVAAAALPRLRRRYDLLFAGFYGHVIVQLMRRFWQGPLLFDAFVSTYDTLCFDRRVHAPDSRAGRLAFWLDRSSCATASHVLLDTHHHVRYFVETFGLPSSHFSAVPVGCSEAIYAFRPLPAPRPCLEVLSYATFLPLHGIETTLRAAALLRDAPVCIRLIGSGPTLRAMQALAQELRLDNVVFDPPVAPQALSAAIAAADICLGGHFGAGDKAGRVIPGKIYQMLAVGRPVIAADAAGNRELLRHGESAYLVPPGAPAALAAAVRELAADASLRRRLAAGGHAAYQARASEAVIAEQLRSIVEAMVAL
jgi:glycosyltransferase involved in cell wall biosynthesis